MNSVSLYEAVGTWLAETIYAEGETFEEIPGATEDEDDFDDLEVEEEDEDDEDDMTFFDVPDADEDPAPAVDTDG